MTKPAKVAVVLFFGLPLLWVILAGQRSHGHFMFTVKVQGQLRVRGRGSRPLRVFVMVLPDREWATDPSRERGFHREAALAWSEPPGPRTFRTDEVRHAPRMESGAKLEEDGKFTIYIANSWTVSYLGPFRLTDAAPPPRYGPQVLRIDILGYDPVILDMPDGTWTEHDGEDGLWATWDLGVVEVPGRP